MRSSEPMRPVTSPIAAALAVLTLAVFLPVRNHEFVDYDDLINIRDDPNLADGLTLEAVRKSFAAARRGNWIPLTHISFALDRSLYGADPTGPLPSNVALHALSALLLDDWPLGRLRGESAGQRFPQGAVTSSFRDPMGAAICVAPFGNAQRSTTAVRGYALIQQSSFEKSAVHRQAACNSRDTRSRRV